MGSVSKALGKVSTYAATFPDVAISTKVAFAVPNKDAMATMNILRGASSKFDVSVRSTKALFATSFKVELDGHASEVRDLLGSLNCIAK